MCKHSLRVALSWFQKIGFTKKPGSAKTVY